MLNVVTVFSRLLAQKFHSTIPLFPRNLASSAGRELEPVSDTKTYYEGSCYVSEHGQRSAACSTFRDREAFERFDKDSARRHPLHIF